MSLLSWSILLAQLVTPQSAVAPLKRIQAKTPVELVGTHSSVGIAGQYANPSRELRKLIGAGLSGDDLYIFPDKTYIYCQWSDISPYAITDKGAWTFSGGVLELNSDSDITWNTRLDRHFLAVRRLSFPKEILLLGIETDLPFFEGEAGSDPQVSLLIAGKQRDATISPAAAAKLKAKLIREYWRPALSQRKP